MPDGHAVVAILDTGVDATHPDLAGQVLPGTSFVDGLAGEPGYQWPRNVDGRHRGGADRQRRGDRGHRIRQRQGSPDHRPGPGWDRPRQRHRERHRVRGRRRRRRDPDVVQRAGLLGGAPGGGRLRVGPRRGRRRSSRQRRLGRAGLPGRRPGRRRRRVHGPRRRAGARQQSRPGRLHRRAGRRHRDHRPRRRLHLDRRDVRRRRGGRRRRRAPPGADPDATNGTVVGRLARTAAPAGTRDETGNGRLDLGRAVLDHATANVEPSGVAGAADGGPYLGPYAAAAVRTWTGLGADANWTTAANWGGTAPVAGDDLVFPAGAARLSSNNNIAPGTTFRSITISGTGYTLAGNAVVIGVGNVTESGAGATNTISLAMAFAATRTVSVTDAGAALTVAGAISRAGGLTKTGTGTLVLAGANTYTGLTTVSAGVVRRPVEHRPGHDRGRHDGRLPRGGRDRRHRARDRRAPHQPHRHRARRCGSPAQPGQRQHLVGRHRPGRGRHRRVRRRHPHPHRRRHREHPAADRRAAPAPRPSTRSSPPPRARLTKTGTGTLVLAGANTYTGADHGERGGASGSSRAPRLGARPGRHDGGLGARRSKSTAAGSRSPNRSPASTGPGSPAAGALRNLANNNTWSGAITLGCGRHHHLRRRHAHRLSDSSRRPASS